MSVLKALLSLLILGGIMFFFAHPELFTLEFNWIFLLLAALISYPEIPRTSRRGMLLAVIFIIFIFLGYIQLPFAWLITHHVYFGLSIILTALSGLAVIGGVLFLAKYINNRAPDEEKNHKQDTKPLP